VGDELVGVDGMAREARGIQRRCRRLIEDLAIPTPITMIRLVEAAARRQNKPIELFAVSGAPPAICGGLLRNPAFDCILYATDATPLHQLHMVAHEVAHLLLRHHGGAPTIDVAQVQALVPGLPEHVVDYVVERLVNEPDPTDRQETEAETFALLIVATAGTRIGDSPAIRAPLASAGDLRQPG
jgi:hypothetical protein